MRNIKLIIEYEGTRYQGFVRQDSDKTISSKLSAAILRVTGEEPEIHAAVKTDAYVHALAQTVNFKTDTKLPVHDIKNALNKILPMDIAVTDILEMPPRFHASYQLKSCAYLYRLELGNVPDLFTRRYTLHFPHALNTKSIEAAGRYLCGTHDFSGFSSGKQKKSTKRSVSELSLYFGPSENQLQFYICADSFLRKMPQLIIGTLLDIGTGLRAPEDILEILNGSQKSSSPASPIGLCLSETNYI